jgi:uncharacterized protein YqjF (DUF2071 family)
MLPKHPFPVRATFRHCLLANFAIKPEVLAAVLPAPIQPAVTHDAAWLSVVIAQMKDLRPAGVPRALGVTYNQIVYRAVVTYGDHRGVHFLRSDANSRLMSATGNAMSFFRFHYSEVDIERRGAVLRVRVATDDSRADIRAEYDLDHTAPELPATSRFTDLDDAKTSLVELFTAYHPNPARRTMDCVDITRNDWRLTVVNDPAATFSYMTSGTPFTSQSAVLDSVFAVEDLEYHWHRVRREPIR